MIYRFIRPIATIAFKVHFNKIHITGKEKIPKDKPVILAVNHPTAFIEPCLLACFQDNNLNFLIRGDIWGNSFYNKLMEGVHLIPIYRQKDGYENLTKNYETFTYCNKALNDKKTLVVLPEGTTIQEKRLRPIKKGLARIVAGALEEYPGLDIQIIPVGANYTYADKARTTVMIEVGDPLPVQSFFEGVPTNKAVLQLTNALRDGMNNCIVNIPNKEDDDLVEAILPLIRSQHPEPVLPIVSYNNDQLEREKMAARIISEMEESEKLHLQELVTRYYKILKENHLKDTLLPFKDKTPGFKFVSFLLKLPSLLGFLINIGPIYFARSLTHSKVKQLEFKLSVFLGVAIFSWAIYYLMVAGLLGFIGWKWSLVWLILAPILAFAYLMEREMHKKLKPVSKIKRADKGTRDALLHLKMEILKQVGI
ncbi:MAG: 1-acyl-sn-glycerol-3-phosphate acyltransferase [Saprospiraceae bacterium]